MKHPLTAGLIVLLIFAVAIPAWAGDHNRQKPKPGLSGKIDVGSVWMKTQSNIVPEDDNKRLTSLSQDAQSESEFMPEARFEVAWTFENGTIFYGGIPMDSEPKLTLGIKHDTGQFGEFDVALFYNIDQEVWKDPYLTGVNRAKTDEDGVGGRMAWKLSALSLSYELKMVDVDQDDVGTRMPGLMRDGTIHKVSAGWEFEFGNGFSLTPVAGMERGCLDGRSQEYKGYNAGLEMIKVWDSVMVMVMAQMGNRDHEAVHPIFGKTRDDDFIEAMTIVTWFDPLGFKNFNLSLGTGYERVDSNINFYDSKGMMSFITVGYQFGSH